MTTWGEIFLGVIAAATLGMALVQIGAVLYGWMLARRIARLVAQIEQDIKPLADSLNAIARDAARAASLTVVQVERVDKLFGDLAMKIEDTAATVQRAVLAPLREGTAILAGLRAALHVVRSITPRSAGAGARTEEEDALFIG